VTKFDDSNKLTSQVTDYQILVIRKAIRPGFGCILDNYVCIQNVTTKNLDCR